MAAPKKRARGSSRHRKAMAAAGVSQVSSLSDPRLYLNLELSELAFNWRVLHQAEDESVPLLERARFLSIAASNIDEFFQCENDQLRRIGAQIDKADLPHRCLQTFWRLRELRHLGTAHTLDITPDRPGPPSVEARDHRPQVAGVALE